MAKASKVSPTLNPNISCDNIDDGKSDDDVDYDEENDDVASLKVKGEIFLKLFTKINLLVPTSWKSCLLPLKARNTLRSWSLI